MHFEYRPKWFRYTFSFVGVRFSCNKGTYTNDWGLQQYFEWFWRVRIPSRIFCSNSSNVGSMSSHPSGGCFLPRRTFGIFLFKFLRARSQISRHTKCVSKYRDLFIWIFSIFNSHMIVSCQHNFNMDWLCVCVYAYTSLCKIGTKFQTIFKLC